MNKLFQIFFLCLGIVLFIFLLIKSDLHSLSLQLESVKLVYFIVAVIYAFFWRYLHALSFYILCGLKDTNQSVFILGQILSNTISDIYPIGNTGGEVYRVYKMSHYYPQYKDVFIGRTVLYNTFYALAMLFVFLISGVYLSIMWELPHIIKIIFFILIISLGILIFLLLYLQSKGLISLLLKPLFLFPSQRFQDFLHKVIARVEPIDESMRGFFSIYPKRTCLFIFLMFLSRMLTIGEVLLLGLALNINLTFSQAVLINVVDGFVRIAFFLIPNGQIGVLEATIVSLGGIIGQSTTVMMSLALLQRARAIIWDGIGLFLLLIEKIYKRIYAK